MSKKIIIKFGGSLAQNNDALNELTKAVSELVKEGHQVALVHGGGKDINENLSLLKEEVKFINGLRVTDAPVLKMVEMTLSGYVNKMLVRLFIIHGAKAVGISGVDGMLFEAKKIDNEDDLGFVGDIINVNNSLIETLWNDSYIPVVSPISVSADGQSWNINADNAASALAVALKADQLVFVSDVPGVLNDGKVIPALDEAKIEELIASEVISGGMIPKTRSSLESIKAGVKSIHIVGWSNSENFMNQLLGQANHGTIIS